MDRSSGRKLLAKTAALAGALAAAACGSSTTGASGGGGGGGGGKGPVEMAVFHAFSGPNAAYGPEAAAGCYPAARSINAAGGILGHQLQCTPVDSKGDPADAVPAA